MNQLRNIPFKSVFFGAIAVASLLFLVFPLFTLTDSVLFTQVLFELRGHNLLIGVNRLPAPQLMIWLVFILVVTSAVAAQLNNNRKFLIIPVAGAASAVLLFLQIGIMGRFSATPAYYVIMALAVLSALHVRAHKPQNSDE